MNDYPKVYLYKRIVQAKLFMDEHYASEIHLGDTLDEACYSRFHFIRLFRKIYGVTPHRYLIAVRLSKAAELLKAQHSVTETCFGVGFQSLSSFTSLFRKHFGITPSAYLLRHQQYLSLVAAKPLLFIPGCFAEKNGWKEKQFSTSHSGESAAFLGHQSKIKRP